MKTRAARLLFGALAMFGLLCSPATGSGSAASAPFLPAPQSGNPSDQPLTNSPYFLLTPTYDEWGQVVHPDIVYFPDKWHGWEYWLVATPYPGGNDTKENPSILVSHDGFRWQDPAGILNPIVLPGTSHLADGDLFYDQDSGQLWVYYVHQRVKGRTYLMRKTSSDGVRWGPRNENLDENLFSVPDHELLSPAVQKVGATYWMWSVNAGSPAAYLAAPKIEYRTSADGTHWSEPADAVLTQDGYAPWHVDVIYVPPKNELWMLFPAYPLGSGANHSVLFFAKSTDGINWTTYGRPALDRSAAPAWDHSQIYRSTLLYDDQSDRLRVWYSARDGIFWHMGYTQSTLAGFMERLQTPAPSGITQPANGDRLAGQEPVTGYANDPHLERWQLELLPHGEPDAAVLLAQGTTSGSFSYSLDTRSYPDGSARLRLRVVRSDGSVGEDRVDFVIANARPATDAHGQPVDNSTGAGGVAHPHVRFRPRISY